ncbi:MAG: hypothetical protein ACK4Y7_01190 [Caldimicrobium sp.]
MIKKNQSLMLMLFIGLIIVWSAPLFAKKKHPKIEADLITEDPVVCSKCHSSQFQAWEKGLHGLNQVRCFICHGDLEKRFEKISQPSNCIMCHEAKVNDLSKNKEYKNCFDCHKGHTLEVKPGSKNIHIY